MGLWGALGGKKGNFRVVFLGKKRGFAGFLRLGVLCERKRRVWGQVLGVKAGFACRF